MSKIAEKLTESLRVELLGYLELLELFDRQRKLILERKADEILSNNSDLDAKVDHVSHARQRRILAMQQFALVVEKPEDSTLQDLRDLLPEPFQKDVNELMEKTNETISVIQRLARHNRILLEKSIQFSEDVIRAVQPNQKTNMYNRKGTAHPGKFNPVTKYRTIV